MFFYRSVSLFDQEGGGGEKRKKNPLGIAQKGTGKKRFLSGIACIT